MSRRFYLPQSPSSHTHQPGGRNWDKFTPVLLVGLVLVLIVLLLRWYLGDDGWFTAPTQARFSNPAPARRELVASSPTPAGDAVSKRQMVDSAAAPAMAVATPIRIQVLNGCGVKGLTRAVTPALRAKGFDVRESRNAANFDYPQSLVIDRKGNAPLAQAVADSLGIDHARVSTEIIGNQLDIDVSVVVGRDYRNLKLDLSTAMKE